MLHLPEKITDFMKKFRDQNFEIFIVGGTVRGLLMDVPVSDWDFTTNAKPEEIRKMFPHSFYNNTFGTVGIPIEMDDTQHIFEVTTYRKESGYTNARHPDEVTWSDTITDDLARRDFTINAIAYDGAQTVDPYNGQNDIKAKVIRAVGDPDIRFGEDALRLMRAVRQAAQLGFEIEEHTLKSILKNAEKINQISGERIRDEFFKLLVSSHSAEGILLLRSTGILKHILPEVEKNFDVDQKSPERHHIYDVGTHLVESLRNCPSDDVITRFATLIHDIGKAETYRKDPKTEIITFYNHEVVGEKMAAEIADRFKLSKDQKKKLVLLVRHHQFTVTEEQTDKAIRRFIRQIGVENIDDMLALRTGDRLGSGSKETSWRTELFKKRLVEVQNVPFTVHDLKITGHDVMEVLGIKPGPKIGDIMDQIFEEVDDEKIPNEREALLARLRELKNTDQ
ncbi:CCA tRNA nucleotidyltransferase [Candidatus Roizmanbacteria bacterium]|nr:MAG: CCA tRNA nucleotidyltransferase [Candidatus Roizmanbacteria bacterium]